MANILASAIVDQAEEILQDSSNDRWSATELLAWLNMGARAIVREKPDSYPVRETALLSAGIWQTLPTNAIMLLDAIANKSLTPADADTRLTIPYANLGSELVTNGTMEADSGWSNVGSPTTNERSSTYAQAGTYSRKFVTDAADEGVKSGAFTTSTSYLYRYRVWVRPSVGQVKIQIKNGAATGWSVNVTESVTSGVWNLLQGYFVELAGGAGAYISVIAASGATAYLDGASVLPMTNPITEVLIPTDYDVMSSPISVVSRKWLDSAVPSWTTDTASATVKHVVYDPKSNPKLYGVYPQNDGNGYIEILTAKLPADVAIGSSILLGDEYAEMLLDYILFRAFSRDSDYSQNAQRAMAHYNNFLMLLGKLDANELIHNPKKVHGAE